MARFSKDGATVDPETILDTSKEPTKTVTSLLLPLKVRASTRTLLGAIEAERKVAYDVVCLVGVKHASSTEEFTVVVTGVGSFALEVTGNTAADTGGGISEAVATLPGDTAIV